MFDTFISIDLHTPKSPLERGLLFLNPSCSEGVPSGEWCPENRDAVDSVNITSTTPPSGVNLNALEIRLVTIFSSLSRSTKPFNEFSLDENGKIQGNIDIPAQGAADINLTDITIEGKNISFAIENVPGEPSFSGELDETGKKIEGNFTQGPAEGTFLLEKAL